MAWPGKTEMFYFHSLYAGIPLESLKLVMQTILEILAA